MASPRNCTVRSADTQPQKASHDVLMRRATYASVTVAALLIGIKGAAWAATDAVALLGSLADSLLDLLASGLNLLAVHHALTPPDREHRFGHGKAEALAGLAQAVVIFGSAAFVAIEAVRRLADPQPIEHSLMGIGVMAVSILLTAALLAYQRRVLRRTSSLAITADALHYAGDLLTNLGVIAALVLAGSGVLLADPVMALAVATYVGWNAWSILRAAFDQLMDRELPDDVRDRIKQIAAKHPQIINIHDLRTRSSGLRIFIQVHAVMASHLPLLDAHRIADELEAEIRAEFPRAEVIIHQDPAGIVEMPK